MEVRDYTGAFVIDGREIETMELRIIVSTGGDGGRIGSGSFAVPAALAGQVTAGPLRFRTDTGAEITLVVRDFVLTEGRAYFLTEGEVPELRGARRA